MSEPQELLELVHALHRRMLECVEPVARGHGLSRMAMLVLRLIKESPGETVSDLARTMEIAKSHISTTVELLSREGFVEKGPDPEDRRLVRLFPTERTQALGQAILAEARRSLGDVLDAVPPDALRQLQESLRIVLFAFARRTQECGSPVDGSEGPGAKTPPGR